MPTSALSSRGLDDIRLVQLWSNLSMDRHLAEPGAVQRDLPQEQSVMLEDAIARVRLRISQITGIEPEHIRIFIEF